MLVYAMQLELLNQQHALGVVVLHQIICIILMGNKNIQGLPAVIAKNWQQLPSNKDVYRSKLTSEFVREHSVNIQKMSKIEQLKQRMKETNQYICRVTFYCHSHGNLYYVYTDETRNRPFVHNLQQWKIHKQNIVESFISLSRRYGPTNVCKQMIGVDHNGQIKIWINPDVLSSKPWLHCSSQAEMIADILNIFKNIQQQSSFLKLPELAQVEAHNFNNPISTRVHQKRSQIKKRSQGQGIQYLQEAHGEEKHKNRQAAKNSEKKKFIPYFLKSKEAQNKLSKTVLQKSAPQNKTNIQSLTNEVNLLFSPQYNPQNSVFFQDDFQWERTKTQNFNNLFISNSLNHLEGNKSQSFKQVKKNDSSSKLKLVKSTNLFQNRQKLQLSKGKNQKLFKNQQNTQRTNFSKHRKNQLSNSSDKSLIKNFSLKKQNQSFSIEKKNEVKNFSVRTTSQNSNHNFPLVNPNENKKKLSGKLGNVAYMPVRQQRESQLTYFDPNENQNKKPNRKESMTVSQELFRFFDESQKSEYNKVQQRIRKKSILYQDFKNEVNQLFND